MKRSRVAAAALVSACVFVSAAALADFNPQGRVRKKPAAAAKAQPSRGLPKPAGAKPATLPAAAQPGAGAPTTAKPPSSTDERSHEVLVQRYTAIVLRQPGATFPLQRLAELYRERDGNLDTLLSEFRKRSAPAAAERYPALIALAGLLEQAGESLEATATLRTALALKPNDPTALLGLAQADEAAGNKPSARAVLEQTLPLLTNDTEKEQLTRRLLSLCLDIGDYDAAKRYHTELVRRAGGSFLVRAELGRELSNREQWQRAELEYRELVRVATGDNRALAPALRDLGRALAAQNKHEEALTTFKRASALVSESGLKQELLDAITDLYRQRNELPEFIKQLQLDRSEDTLRLRLLGRLLEETGQIEGALAAYRKTLARQTTDIELRLRVIHLLQLQGQLDEAIKAYTELIALAPRNPDFVFQLSEALLQRGERVAALTQLDKLQERSSEDEQTLSALVEVFERMGENERSQKLLERLARSGTTPEHLVQLGSRYYRDGASDKAIKTWKRLLITVPDRSKALLALGEVYLEHDMAAQALEALNEAVELDAKSQALRKALAVALERTASGAAPGLRLQRYEQARRIWEQLLTEPARDEAQATEARQHIITLWSLSGTLQDRIRPLERNLKVVPPNLASARLLAEVYIRLRRNDQAERVLRAILAAAPGDISGQLRLERVLVLQHNLSAAIDVLSKLVTLDPKRARDYYQRMAQYAAELYRDEDAIRFATRAVALSPDDAVGHEKLGHMYQRRQNVDQAIAEYQKAIAKNERLFSAYFSLAELLSSRGQTAEADQLLRRVVRSAVDDDLITQAVRLSLQLHLSDNTVQALEHDLLPIALANPGKPIYRRLLVEIYGALTFPLVSEAQTSDVARRTHAEQELRRIGMRAVKPLLDALGDSQTAEQSVAIELLTHLKNESAAPALFAFATGNADANLRQRAMIAAGAAPDAALQSRLKSLLFADGSPSVDEADPVSLAAVWALCRMPEPQAQKLVRGLLTSDAPSARALAALSLAARRAPQADAQILPLLAPQQGSLTRSAAAFALGELGNRRHVGALRPLLDSADPRLRRAALLALARLDDTPSRGAITLGVLDTDPTTQRYSVDAAIILATHQYQPIRAAFSVPSGHVDVSELLDGLSPTAFPAEDRQRALLLLADDLAAIVGLRIPGTAEHLNELVELLLSSSDELEFEPLVERPTTPKTAFSSEVEAALERIARKVTPELVQLSRHPSAAVRSSALRFLATRDEDSAKPCVLLGLNDSDESVVRAGLLAIAHHPRAATLPAVTQLLRASTPWALRLLALQTLSQFSLKITDNATWQQTIAELRRVATHDPFALVREAAIKTAVELTGSDTEGLLTEAAEKDEELRVRATATRLLKELRAKPMPKRSSASDM